MVVESSGFESFCTRATCSASFSGQTCEGPESILCLEREREKPKGQQVWGGAQEAVKVVCWILEWGDA